MLVIVGFYFVFYFIVLHSSLPTLKGKSRAEEMDPKKQKKIEKEEKEFRKKFKVCLSLISLSMFINPVHSFFPGSHLLKT